ncbi:MAG: pyruvate kinase [Phycisphaeraceae bacterium]
MVDAREPFILTKIIATMGPSCCDVDTLTRLIHAGVRVVRINFSHGTFDAFKQSLDVARAASRSAGVAVGVLGDLCGPKIRVQQVKDGPIELVPGDRLEFVEQDGLVERDTRRGAVIVPSTYPALVREVQPGHRVLIDDGQIRSLAVERVTDETGAARLVCQVIHGGPLSDRKGINLPDTPIAAPSLTPWDRQCVAWAIENELDFLALSFVRKREDVEQLRALLAADTARPLPIIAKIEKPQALQDIEAICHAADGIMVARGDLGVEMDLAEVPIIQRRILEVAHDYGKPVIIATQMLQSMIEHATPTRAEVSDVANAIFDGADCVMLSGETAVGKHVEQAVRTMARTAATAERYVASRRDHAQRPPRKHQASRYRTAALAHGVAVVVHDLDARYVVIWSELGGGARYLSQNRLTIPIIALSSNEAALRQMSLGFGVRPVHMDRPKDTEALLGRVDALLQERGWAQPGEPVVLAMGEPLGTAGVTNEIRLHYVGDVCRVDAGPARG